MSHVATVELMISSLDDLRSACRQLGLEFVQGQETYKWYGRSVGDFPLPEGFTEEDLGKCEHAIRLPANHPLYQEGEWKDNRNGPFFTGSYEIGVVRRRDGKPGYSLMWDFFSGGFGLENVVGPNCDRLKQAYAVSAAIRTGQQQGFRVQQTRRADGSIQVRLSK